MSQPDLVDCSADTVQNWQSIQQRMTNIYNYTTLILFFIGLLASILFSVLILKQNRKKRFEIQILLSMVLSYLAVLLYFGDYVLNSERIIHEFQHEQVTFYITACLAVNMFSHWTYASQYLQTWLILPSLLKKAVLVMAKY